MATLVAEDQYTWGSVCHLAAMAFNTSFHDSHGEQSFFLMFMRDAHVAADLFRPARVDYSVGDNYAATTLARLRDLYAKVQVTTARATSKRELQYNKRAKPHKFQLGDKVFLKADFLAPGDIKKMSPHYRINPTSRTDMRVITTHINKIKLCPERISADGQLLEADFHQ